jgi:hypothetical protein
LENSTTISEIAPPGKIIPSAAVLSVLLIFALGPWLAATPQQSLMRDAIPQFDAPGRRELLLVIATFVVRQLLILWTHLIG